MEDLFHLRDEYLAYARQLARDRVLLPGAMPSEIALAVVEGVRGNWPDGWKMPEALEVEIVNAYDDVYDATAIGERAEVTYSVEISFSEGYVAANGFPDEAEVARAVYQGVSGVDALGAVFVRREG